MTRRPEPTTNIGELAVRWQRFRSLSDTGWLDIKPVTLLIGRNNTGKTSLLAPLLLLKQTLRSKIGNNALMTRGELLNLGSFVDIVHGHDRNASLEFGIRWHSHRPPAGIRPVGAYPPGELDLTFVEGQDPAFIDLSNYIVRDYYRRRMISRKARAGRRSYTLSIPAARVFDEGASDSEPPPDDRTARALESMKTAMLHDTPTDFLFSAARTRSPITRGEENDDEPTFPLPTPPREVRAYNQIADFVQLEIDTLLEYLSFIGPLREPPRRVYEMSGEMPTTVGTRGEFAPEILFRWRDIEPIWGDLHEWLRRFQFGETIECMPLGEDTFALYVRRTADAPPTSILDMGFGLSQVLPLIVQTLIPGRADRLVVEQPEIHLNPALQSVLADLFVAYAAKGGTAIIETHSEHLLLRLRTLIASAEISNEDVAVYFVSEEEGSSRVDRIAISDAGHIEAADWPDGFFADGLRESFELVAAQSRARSTDAS